MVDTNIASHFMRFPEGRVAQRMNDFDTSTVGISIIVVSELRFGVAKVRSRRLHNQVEWMLSKLTLVPFNEPADHHYAEIRAHLQGRGRPIGPNDIFIAAHALSLGLPLVTANITEFSRVPNLVVENWLD